MHWIKLLSPIYKLLKMIGKDRGDEYLLKQAEEIQTHLDVDYAHLEPEEIVEVLEATGEWAAKGCEKRRGRRKRRKK